MNNEGVHGTGHRRYGIVGIALAIATLVIIGLLIHINSLQSQITSYKAESFAQSAQLRTYEQLACSNSPRVTKADGIRTHSIEVDGQPRTYRVHAPANYDPNLRYPLVLSFDGIDGSGAQMQSYAGLDTIPALVVYPDSLPSKEGFTAWQGAPYSQDGSYDIEFIKALLQTVAGQYCIDSAKVFATGMSNGGAFATIVGCQLGDKIRAVASVSGAYYSSCKGETRTPSLLVMHSVDDNRVPFYGEVRRGLPEVPVWVKAQTIARSCADQASAVTTAHSKQYTWVGCKDDSTVKLIVLNGQEHGWLKVPSELEKGTPTTAQYIWDFFESTL